MSQASAADEDHHAMAERYARQVDKRLSLPATEARRYGELAQQMLKTASIELQHPQYVVLVDRNDPWQFVNFRVT